MTTTATDEQNRHQHRAVNELLALLAANFAKSEVEKIINLGIIYCGLGFMVHSSFSSGMNRKYWFITIFGTQRKEVNGMLCHEIVSHENEMAACTSTSTRTSTNIYT